jgi:hypothetical protein
MIKLRSSLILVSLMPSMLWASFAPYEPEAAWTKQSISVCWGTENHFVMSQMKQVGGMAYNEDQKQAIKTIIQKEFTLKEVGIEFVGWKDCDVDASNGDVVLLRQEIVLEDGETAMIRGGMASIGQFGEVHPFTDPVTLKSYSKMVRAFSLAKPSMLLNTSVIKTGRVTSAEKLQLIALHEFGHLGGLRHEHIRYTEAKADPNCRLTSSLNKLQPEEAYQSTKFTGPYDYNSIMNYCFINAVMDATGLEFKVTALGQKGDLKLTDETLYKTTPAKSLLFNKPRTQINLRIGLSKLDKEALKCMYVYTAEEAKNQKCNEAL